VPKPPTNPHDALFRHVLSRAADAASELRTVVPDAVASRIEWDELTLQPGSFVSPELRSRFSDLLFRTRLSGHPAYIYLLLEHQSSSDDFMPLRMLDYLVNIWNQHRRQHPDDRLLPAIIPIVVHSNHTGRPWNAATEIADLIDIDPDTRRALGPHLPSLRFLLDDIAALDLPALHARDLTPAARVMFTLHKIALGNTHLGTDLLPLADDLRAIINNPATAGDLQAVVTYIFIVSDTLESDFQPLIDLLGPRAREAIMTTAERLRAEGEARGKAIGCAEGEARGKAIGRAEGEAIGRADILVQLLTLKFGALPTWVTETISAAGATQLRIWAKRVLTADHLDDIFTQ
jgi:hypothetical protein